VFDKLLARLEPDLPDSARRYKQVRLKMTKFFQWKRCADAESLADETIARAIKNVVEGLEIKANNPYIYIFVIAKNVYREYVRGEIKQRSLFSRLSDQPVQSGDWQDCRVQCLRELPPEKLRLLQTYYLDEKSSIQLAGELNVTVNALRLKIFRIKKDLESCYENCLRNI
jgi:DNA-directed RNA polymerase specialized sigma24 family protein